jgi:hypothetical protein
MSVTQPVITALTRRTRRPSTRAGAAADRRRRVAVAAGAALLAAGLAGCSGDRSSVGPVRYSSGHGNLVEVSNPVVDRCHRLSPGGARAVTNGTLVDLRVFRSRDCSGPEAAYIATTLTDTATAGGLPWRSYDFVH